MAPRINKTLGEGPCGLRGLAALGTAEPDLAAAPASPVITAAPDGFDSAWPAPLAPSRAESLPRDLEALLDRALRRGALRHGIEVQEP